jgi:hypothetical protein
MSKITMNKTKIVVKSTEETMSIQADVCVVGAGVSGFMAALQVARLGKKVVLADSSYTFGGQATNSMIGLFCGLYSRTNPNYLFTYGIVEEMLRDLEKSGGLYFREAEAATCIAFDEQTLLEWIEDNVLKEKVVPLIGACIDEVRVKDRRISDVVFNTKYGKVKVNAISYVDATGDASLTYLAGLPCRVSDIGPVYGSQMVIIENIDFDKLPEESIVNETLKKEGHLFGLERRDGLIFCFPRKNRIIVNMTHVETPLDPLGTSVSSIIGKQRAKRVVDFLKAKFPDALGNSTIHAYGQLGSRQTRWIVGRKQLIADDIRNGVKFDDAIARTTWPIELHNTMESYQWEVFGKEHVHYVPFSAMTPPDIDNLIAAGRCIDSDLIALSSVRVMGPCMAMGIAAAHALDLAGSGSVHEIDIKQLQERLSDNLERKDPLHFGK